MKDITVEEFLKCCEASDVPELRDKILTTIARFYRRMPQEEMYTVHGDSVTLHKVMGGAFELFTKYGIYPDLSDIKHFNIVDESKEYVWYVDPSRNVEDQFIEMYNRFHKAPACCVVLCNSVATNVVADIREVCSKGGIQINIWNTVEVQTFKDNNTRSDKFIYEDITEYLKNNLPSGTIVDSAMLGRVSICKYLLEQSAPNKIFYINRDADESVKKAYTVIAAILTYKGVNFELLGSDMNSFLRNMSDLISREYTFLDDYLRKIANPVDVAVKFNLPDAYICVRQGSVAPVKLHVYETELNLKTMTLRNKNLRASLYEYHQIETISLIDAAGLNVEFEQALTNGDKLNKLFAEFEEIVDSEIHLRDNTALNFTNVLLYKCEDKVFLGYVTNIETSYVYAMKPLMKNYKAFVRKLSLAEYDLLCDVSVFADSDKILKSISGMTRLEKCHFDKPRFAMGMLLSTIPTIRQEVTEQSGLSFLDIGIWSTQTSQCRKGAQEILLESFNRALLRQRNFLTVWGGCHPSVLTELIADSRVWR